MADAFEPELPLYTPPQGTVRNPVIFTVISDQISDEEDELTTTIRKIHEGIADGEENTVWDSLNGLSSSLTNTSGTASEDRMKILYNKFNHFTILHRACQLSDPAKALETTKDFLQWYNNKAQFEQVQILVNEKDSAETKQTALHIAVNNLDEDLATLLIKAGADVNIKCAKNDEPIQLIYTHLPGVISAILDSLIEADPELTGSEQNFKLKLNFRTIIGFHGIEENTEKPIIETKHLADALGRLEESDQPKILGHPVTHLFLEEKWNKTWPFFCLSGFLHMFFYTSFIYFVMDLYSEKCPYRNESGISCSREDSPSWIWNCLLIFVIVEMIKEVWKVGCLRKSKEPKYLRFYLFHQTKNILSWMLVLITIFLVSSSQPIIHPLEYWAAALGFLIAFCLIGFQMKKIKLLEDYIEVYVPIKVIFRTLLAKASYFWLIIGVAGFFMILLPEFQVFSFVAGILGMRKTGRVNYDNILHGKETEASSMSPMLYLLLGFFIKLIHQLYKSDWKELFDESNLLTVAGKLEQIYLLERFLLSDILLKWPGKDSWILKSMRMVEADEPITCEKYLRDIPENLKDSVRDAIKRSKSTSA